MTESQFLPADEANERLLRAARETASLELPLVGRIAAGAPVESFAGQETLAFRDFLGGGVSDQTWDYFQAGRVGRMEIELPLHSGRGPRPGQIVECIYEIRDLFRRDPALGTFGTHVLNHERGTVASTGNGHIEPNSS